MNVAELLDAQVEGWRSDIEAAVRVQTSTGEWLWVEYGRGEIRTATNWTVARAALACPPQQRRGAAPKVVGGTGIHSPSELGSRAACPPQQEGK